MVKRGVKENEFGSEEKNIYTKIKNKEFNNFEQLKTGRDKLLKFIRNKEIDKKIVTLTKKVE